MHLHAQMKAILMGLILLVLTAVSCKTSEVVLGPANCETGVLGGADLSFRDVLPGVDGPLQRERTYFVQGKPMAHRGAQQGVPGLCPAQSPPLGDLRTAVRTDDRKDKSK